MTNDTNERLDMARFMKLMLWVGPLTILAGFLGNLLGAVSPWGNKQLRRDVDTLEARVKLLEDVQNKNPEKSQ